MKSTKKRSKREKERDVSEVSSFFPSLPPAKSYTIVSYLTTQYISLPSSLSNVLTHNNNNWDWDSNCCKVLLFLFPPLLLFTHYSQSTTHHFCFFLFFFMLNSGKDEDDGKRRKKRELFPSDLLCI